MILFVGLNDWIIRNMLSSGFKDAIAGEDVKLGGLVYKENYELYKDELCKTLRMATYPMDTLKWNEYGDRLNGAAVFLDYASVSKLARVNNRTLRLMKRQNVANSSVKTLKLDLKYKFFKLLQPLSIETRFINKFENSIKDLTEFADAVKFLKENEVKLVISCSPETPYDTIWVLAANELGINTYAWIRSWDNITSKISYLPSTKGLFVWSDLMEKEFKEYYPGYSTEVYKVGSSQFDGHANKENILPYKEFCETVGLDPDREFVLYTTGGPHICKDEHLVIDRIANEIDKLGLENKPQLLVRIHPYAWRTNLKMEFTNENIVTWPPKDRIEEFRGGKTKGLLDEYKIMVSTFFYQKININVASTVTIDSCIFDKPVINIAFDAVPGKKYVNSIAKYYEYDHYKPLVESGGVRVVYDIDEFKKEFLRYFNDPSLDKENRKRIVEMECGVVDGKAGTRFAEKIAELYLNLN